jgi:hypothetical protein
VSSRPPSAILGRLDRSRGLLYPSPIASSFAPSSSVVASPRLARTTRTVDREKVLFARRALSPAVVGVNAEVLVIALAIVVVVSKVTSRRRRPPTARSGKSDFRRARPTLSPSI